MQDSQLPESDLISAAQSTLPSAEATALSAGQLLRQAREAAQLHRASLAATLKVPVKKIEALENDDWHALPDLAFTRALASSICRQLKIDPQPILALLPSVRQQAPQTPATLAEDKALEAARQKLSTAPGPRRATGVLWATAALFVLGALGAAWWWQNQAHERAATVQELNHEAQTIEAQSAQSEHIQHAVATPMQVASAAGSSSMSASGANTAISPLPLPATSAAVVASSPLAVAITTIATPTANPTPISSPAAALLPASTTATAGVLELQAKAETWVQVRDAQNKLQVSRLLQAGERVQVQSQAPYKVWTGRAEGLQLLWQGKPIDALMGKTGSLRVQIPPLSPATRSGTAAAPVPAHH